MESTGVLIVPLEELDIPENFVKCGICKNVYSNPQQLKCLHTFCDSCVESLANDGRDEVICPRCRHIQGPSQRTSDYLIQSIQRLLENQAEINCLDHDQKYNSFCHSCKVILCDECKEEKHIGCPVVSVQPDTLLEIVSSVSSEVGWELNKSKIQAGDLYEKSIEEQRIQYKVKSDTSTKISSFFYNLKTKIVEHLALQEQIIKKKLYKWHSENENQLSKTIRESRSVNERIGQDIELLAALEKTTVSMSHLRILELVKSEMSTCISQIPAVHNYETVKFCPNETEIKSIFEVKPCHLQLSNDNHDPDLDDLNLGMFDIADLLSYTAPSTNNSQDDETTRDLHSQTLPITDTIINARSVVNETESSTILHTVNPILSDYPNTNNTVLASANDAMTTTRSCEVDHLPTPDDTVSAAVRPNDTSNRSFQFNNINNAAPLTFETNDTVINQLTDLNAKNHTAQGQMPVGFFQNGDFIKSVHSHFHDDSKTGSPVGMTWIEEKHLLIVDRSNHKLKLITEDGGQIGVMMFQEGEPWDIAYTNRIERGHICAVCFPIAKAILFVLVNVDKIDVIRKINTVFGYCSLAHDKIGHTLVCGICPPFGIPAIHIINSQGIVLNEFVLDSLDHPLFEYPRSIDVTEDGCIVICDWMKKRLLFMRTDGYILGTYSGCDECPLVEPIGTDLDGFGNVLVSDTKTNTIQTISVKDRRVIATLKLDKEIVRPREITVTRPGNFPTLAVATNSSIDIFALWS